MTQIVTPPKFTFQFSPTTNPLDTPVWVDISSYVTDFSCKYGRQFELNRVEAGTASFTLDNNDRRFDPLNTASPYYPNLLPMKKFQVIAPNALPISGGNLTVSSNEITDASRITNTQGDGLALPSGFGIWEGTTNLNANGGFETNTTGWTQVSSTLTRITTAFKFGAACGNIVTTNAAANEGAYETFTATAAPYTVSAWVKGAVGGTVRMAVRDNTGANPQTGTAITLTATWQRITLTTTNLTAATWRVYVETNIQQNITFQVDGVQAELKPIATPYVETNGGTASRTTARVQAPAALLNATQGWIAARLRMGYASTSARVGDLFLWYTDATHLIEVGIDASNRWYVSRTTGTTVLSSAQTFNEGAVVTVEASWTSTTLSISINGAVFTSTANTTIPVIGAALSDVGSGAAAGGFYLDCDVYWFACGTGTLSNADAATIAALPNTLTAYSASVTQPIGDATMMQWPANCALTAVWNAATANYRVPSTGYVWTGFIEQWPATWEGPYWAQVECTAVDAFESLSLADVASRQSTLTTVQGSNKDITYTSLAVGSGNNAITIAYVNTGTLSVSVTQLAITVNINAGTTTASSIITAVNANTQANFLVTASLAPGSSGAGTPAAMGATNLSGGTYPQELSGTRIGRILDAVNWPTSDRVIDAGQANVVSRSFLVSDHQKAKSHINDVENSELGYIFIDARGFVNYHDRAHRTTSTLSTVVQGVYGDLGTELEYDEVVPNFDRTYIYNYVAVTAGDTGVAQVASDQTSINQYMLRTYTISTELVDSTAALSLAQFILSVYKQPSLRFAQMTIEPMNDVGLWLQALSRTLGDRVTVIRRPPTHGATIGPPLAADSFIESVAWQMNDGLIDVNITYEMSPSSYSQQGLKLDDVVLGLLDSGNVLGL